MYTSSAPRIYCQVVAVWSSFMFALQFMWSQALQLEVENLLLWWQFRLLLLLLLVDTELLLAALYLLWISRVCLPCWFIGNCNGILLNGYLCISMIIPQNGPHGKTLRTRHVLKKVFVYLFYPHGLKQRDISMSFVWGLILNQWPSRSVHHSGVYWNNLHAMKVLRHL